MPQDGGIRSGFWCQNAPKQTGGEFLLNTQKSAYKGIGEDKLFFASSKFNADVLFSLVHPNNGAFTEGLVFYRSSHAYGSKNFVPILFGSGLQGGSRLVVCAYTMYCIVCFLLNICRFSVGRANCLC